MTVLANSAEQMIQKTPESTRAKGTTKAEADQLRKQASDLADRGRYNEALALLTQALERYQAVLEADHPLIVLVHNDIAQQYFNLGDLKNSESHYKLMLTCSQSSFAALSRLETNDKNIPAFVGTELNNLAALYFKQGRWTESVEIFERALTIQLSTIGSDHPEYARTLNNLGVVLASDNNLERAEQCYGQALKIRKQALGENHKDYAMSLHNLGRLKTCQGNYIEARSFLNKALTIRKRVLTENHPEIAASYFGMGELALSQGQASKAVEYHQKALELRLKVLGSNNTEAGASYFALGAAAEKLGNIDQARQSYAQALKIRNDVLGSNHRDTRKTVLALALVNGNSQLLTKI